MFPRGFALLQANMKMDFKNTHFPNIPFKVDVSHCHVYPTQQRPATSGYAMAAVTLHAGPPHRHAELQNLSSAHEDVSMRKRVLFARKKCKENRSRCLRAYPTSCIYHGSTYCAADNQCKSCVSEIESQILNQKDKAQQNSTENLTAGKT